MAIISSTRRVVTAIERNQNSYGWALHALPRNALAPQLYRRGCVASASGFSSAKCKLRIPPPGLMSSYQAPLRAQYRHTAAVEAGTLD